MIQEKKDKDKRVIHRLQGNTGREIPNGRNRLDVKRSLANQIALFKQLKIKNDDLLFCFCSTIITESVLRTISYEEVE